MGRGASLGTRGGLRPRRPARGRARLAARRRVDGECGARGGEARKTGVLHAADLPGVKEVLTTEKAVAEERETIAWWRRAAGGARPPCAAAPWTRPCETAR